MTDINSNKSSINSLIAANRFGLGARPGEISRYKSEPQKELINSLANIVPPSQAPTALSMLRTFVNYGQQKEAIKIKALEVKNTGKEMLSAEELKPELSPGDYLKENSALILKGAVHSSDSINWRLLDFFSNHFSITANTPKTRFLTPSLDWDAIAPNLMGSFETLLRAVIAHPAMLLYLNNEKSIGPNSIKAKENKKKGLNENLAREILELHTLGVNGGYHQKDVLELAKALTGWSVVNKKQVKQPGRRSAFIFINKHHEPGLRIVLGKHYPYSKNGLRQANLILKDLAKHPATAEHVCTKLARHFVSDQPNEKLVKEMTKTWLETAGHLKSVYTTMLKSPYAWQPVSEKYKTPREFVISTLRALAVIDIPTNKLIGSLHVLGQAPYNAGSPAGYGDQRVDWDGSDALFRHIEWAAKVAKEYRKHPIEKLTKTVMGEQLSEQTQLIISRAESQHQAIALLLMSPDFLYR